MAIKIQGDTVIFDDKVFRVGSGTTAQRPSAPVVGMFRYNSTIENFEGYDGDKWGILGGSSSEVIPVSANSATTDIDLEEGEIFYVTVSSNTTINFIKPPANNFLKSATLIIEQDSTGNRDITFSNTRWTDGNLPELTKTSNSIDVLSFFTVNGGSWYFASFVMADVKTP